MTSETATARAREAARTGEIDTICGICPAGCWVTAGLEDGRLTSLRAQEDHPLGMICRLGEHAPEMVYSKHRLRQPLKRTGPPGAFEFEPITWDEAMATIAGRLQQIKAEYGPEACGIYTGRIYGCNPAPVCRSLLYDGRRPYTDPRSMRNSGLRRPLAAKAA